MQFQHSDEVIQLARLLRAQLIDDSPFGNEDAAQEWVKEHFPQVELIAAQKLEREE